MLRNKLTCFAPSHKLLDMGGALRHNTYSLVLVASPLLLRNNKDIAMNALIAELESFVASQQERFASDASPAFEKRRSEFVVNEFAPVAALPQSIGRPVRGRIASDAGAYSSDRYQEEKAEGLRHENGVARLKKLRPIHRRVVKLAVEGFSASEIAAALGKSYHMVYQTLQDPLAKQEIEISLAASRHQLQALQIRGVEVVGAAMRSELPETALKGVDRLMKMQELVGIHREGKETAEDVAQKILAAVQVNVNVNGERVVQIDATHE